MWCPHSGSDTPSASTFDCKTSTAEAQKSSRGGLAGVAGTMRTAAGTTRARSARALRTTSAGTMRTAAGTTRARSARCARLARRGRTPRRRRPRGSAPRRSHSRQRAVRQRGRHPPSGHALRPRWRPLRRVRGRRPLHRRHRTDAGGQTARAFGAIEHLLVGTLTLLWYSTRYLGTVQYQ